MPPRIRPKSPRFVNRAALVTPVIPQKTSSGFGWFWVVLALAAGCGAWYFCNNYSVRRVSSHEKTATRQVSAHVDVVAVNKNEALAELVTFRYIKDENSLNEIDEKGFTPLMRAVMHHDFHVAQLLIDAGADIDFIHPWGFTALQLSIPHLNSQFHEDVQMMRFLISAGADVNFHRFNIQTPLISAARRGTREAVQILLDAGADVHYVDKDGHDALFYARQEKNADAVMLLERARARK